MPYVRGPKRVLYHAPPFTSSARKTRISPLLHAGGGACWEAMMNWMTTMQVSRRAYATPFSFLPFLLFLLPPPCCESAFSRADSRHFSFFFSDTLVSCHRRRPCPSCDLPLACLYLFNQALATSSVCLAALGSDTPSTSPSRASSTGQAVHLHLGRSGTPPPMQTLCEYCSFWCRRSAICAHSIWGRHGKG